MIDSKGGWWILSEELHCVECLCSVLFSCRSGRGWAHGVFVWDLAPRLQFSAIARYVTRGALYAHGAMRNMTLVHARGWLHLRWARICLLILSAAVFPPLSILAEPAQQAYTFRSPNGRIQVSIQMPVPESAEQPRWSATFHDKPILKDCELGLQTADAGELMLGVRVLKEQRRSVDKRVRVLFGKSAYANDSFHEMRFKLETARRTPVDVIFRCYNDAIAVRYELPLARARRAVAITEETTSFRVEGDPTAYVQYLESFTTSHEHEVIPARYQSIRPNALLDMPLTLSWDDGTCVAITEASLRKYAPACP